MKKGTKILILITLILLIGFVGFISYEEASRPVEIPNTQVVGDDRDENGCILSAGYSWCEFQNKCLRSWEEECDPDIEGAIKKIFSQKYNRSVEEIKITIDKREGAYISGGVKFGNINSEGGLFLAYKNGNAWEVVFDGNGGVDCNKMREGFGFPEAILVPNLCDPIIEK